MKNGLLKTIVLVTVLMIIILINAGCQEQKIVGDRKARAIAAENLELKKQLAAKDKEIENLKRAVANREVDKQAVSKAVKAELDKVNADIFEMFENNIKLEEENKALKKQIEELKAGIKK